MVVESSRPKQWYRRTHYEPETVFQANGGGGIINDAD